MTLLVLSAIPNPFFEFAGITAGAVRMNFWRFLVAVGIGKTIRVILLVTVGKALVDWTIDLF
jgi:membrane protein DedA with SNARE-associated domain